MALGRDSVAAAADIVDAIDRLEVSSGELALLRLQHLVLAGHVAMNDEERAEVDRLSGSVGPQSRTGLPAGASAQDVRAAALAGIERWRGRANSPLSDRRTIEAADIISRAYEEIHTAAR